MAALSDKRVKPKYSIYAKIYEITKERHRFGRLAD
jgi:hypothetical protein